MEKTFEPDFNFLHLMVSESEMDLRTTFGLLECKFTRTAAVGLLKETGCYVNKKRFRERCM